MEYPKDYLLLSTSFLKTKIWRNKNPELTTLYVHLLLIASPESDTLGCIRTSYDQIYETYGTLPKNTKKYLELYAKNGLIKYNNDRRILYIQILNYEYYLNPQKTDLQFAKLETAKVKIPKTTSEIERSRMSNSLRYRILKRDRFKCCFCGATKETARLAVDHKIPVSKGGKTNEENLQTLCYDCNCGKGAKDE